MVIINLIFVVAMLALLFNIMYGVLFIFSFKGIRKIYEWFRDDSFLMMDTLGMAALGPSYHIAKKLYSSSPIVARIVMLLYVIVLSYLFNWFIQMFNSLT